MDVKRPFDWNELETLPMTERISRLRERLREITGSEMLHYENPNVPPEIIEQSLRQIVQYEEADMGLVPVVKLPPLEFPCLDNLADEEVHELLWQKIRELSDRRIFLDQTDHLSDRELYEVLCSPEMRECTTRAIGPNGAIHFDILGGYSDEDIELYLRYYADTVDRAFWEDDWPGDELPPHEDPPYSRDCRLPSPDTD
ncbi:MAG: hypothetical protein WAO20_17970 [Acidobacteriota bacterium]